MEIEQNGHLPIQPPPFPYIKANEELLEMELWWEGLNEEEQQQQLAVEKEEQDGGVVLRRSSSNRRSRSNGVIGGAVCVGGWLVFLEKWEDIGQ